MTQRPQNPWPFATAITLAAAGVFALVLYVTTLPAEAIDNGRPALPNMSVFPDQLCGTVVLVCVREPFREVDITARAACGEELEFEVACNDRGHGQLNFYPPEHWREVEVVAEGLGLAKVVGVNRVAEKSSGQ